MVAEAADTPAEDPVILQRARIVADAVEIPLAPVSVRGCVTLMLAEQVDTPSAPVSVNGWETRTLAEAVDVPAVEPVIRQSARIVALAVDTPLAPVSVSG